LVARILAIVKKVEELNCWSLDSNGVNRMVNELTFDGTRERRWQQCTQTWWRGCRWFIYHMIREADKKRHALCSVLDTRHFNWFLMIFIVFIKIQVSIVTWRGATINQNVPKWLWRSWAWSQLTLTLTHNQAVIDEMRWAFNRILRIVLLPAGIDILPARF
jgi:hypothetical protein